MHRLVSETLEIHEKLQRMYKTVYTQIAAVRDKVVDLEQGDRADAAYLMREMAGLFDDLRKEANACKDLLAKTMCLIWAHEVVGDLTTDRSIHGKLARATPRTNMTINIPRPDDPRFVTLCDWLGIPDEVIADGIMRPHWPSLRERISERIAAGEPAPKGFDPYTEHTVTLVAK